MTTTPTSTSILQHKNSLEQKKITILDYHISGGGYKCKGKEEINTSGNSEPERGAVVPYLTTISKHNLRKTGNRYDANKGTRDQKFPDVTCVHEMPDGSLQLGQKLIMRAAFLGSEH